MREKGGKKKFKSVVLSYHIQGISFSYLFFFFLYWSLLFCTDAMTVDLRLRLFPPLYREYTLERMFSNQLLDFVKDELSYRTVVRDLITKVPVLQIVIVNTNSWSCTGYCLSTRSSGEAVPKLDLHPVIKVLFTESSSEKESEIRSGDKVNLFCV